MKNLSFYALFAFFLFADSLFCTQNAFVEKTFSNGKFSTSAVNAGVPSGGARIVIPADELREVKTLRIFMDFAEAQTGDDGYFVLSTGMLTRFEAHPRLRIRYALRTSDGIIGG